ncbi:aminotransferase class I/II-fold pyridoxal phosphate-dependent enzyme [Paraburkholderia heleia]|uniref:aminotransferase class I/II-fold pyridoxal phosphate-dependent enzyme n=1 Tax=Paraburkholderia heleia TaxID=634127 RepID=UPI002AB618A9|nr:aminotransferase class I/II-fold pyridoxal phosphate-dependent enzyme [Paraburkholderia heleia]
MDDGTNDFGDDAFGQAQFVVSNDGCQPYEAVVPPIAQTSLFTFETFDSMAKAFAGEASRHVYSRTTNPTVALFEQKIARLEGADAAIGLASGMAAISGAVMAFTQPGDRIVSVKHVYPDAYRFFETLMKRWGISTTYVDGADLEAVKSTLPGAKVLYLESPTSWTMQVHDVVALASLAHQHGAMCIIDNSHATPIFQRPLAMGVDLVVHSATKYLGGHSDTVAGVVVGRNELIQKIRREICPYIGAKLAPFDAWLLLRGLRTLPLRMKAHEVSAAEIARRLLARPGVACVYHPSVTAALPAGLTGTSGLFSFEVDESIDIPSFCDALTVFRLGVSWGGYESLVFPALVAIGQAAGPNPAIEFEIPHQMIRLHIGLEGTEVLWSDLVQALEQSGKS